MIKFFQKCKYDQIPSLHITAPFFGGQGWLVGFPGFQSPVSRVCAARAPCVAISHRRSLGNASDLIAIVPPSQNSRVRSCVPLDPFVACGRCQHKRVCYGFSMAFCLNKQTNRSSFLSFVDLGFLPCHPALVVVIHNDGLTIS